MRVKRNPFLVVIVAFFLLSPVANVASAQQDQSEGSYIVVLKGSNSSSSVEADISRAGGRTERRFTRVLNGLSVRIKNSEVSRLRNNPNVLSIERDQQMFAVDTQSPTPSWGLDRIDQRSLPLNSTFTATAQGSGVDTYIVDTGIFASHTEFTGRLAAGFSSIADSNGTNDCNGHGTHVAGTTAGTIYGIAKSATLIPVRVLDCSGSGSNSGVIAGLDWIVAHHISGKAAVVNMSLGGGASTALDTAVQNVINDGIVMVVAAGNSNVDACSTSPARATNALTVGATGQYSAGESTDSRSSYSNYGPCLDIFAPGSRITSSWIGGSTATNTISGTSMASPHVAGVAAVLFGRYPGSTASEIASMLLTSATPNVVIGPGTGSPNYLLYLDPLGGTPTAPDAVAPVAPSAPTAITVAPSSGSLSIAFTAGAAGTSPITNYKYSLDGGATWLTRSPASTLSPIIVSGLTNGSTYSVAIRAISNAGDGIASTLVNATIPSAPSEPLLVTALASANRSARVTWTLGVNGGSPITSHVVTAYLNGATSVAKSVTVTGATTTATTVTGLISGGTYTFRVQAINAYGRSPVSLASNSITARK
jgi:subtilisin family serine protease